MMQKSYERAITLLDSIRRINSNRWRLGSGHDRIQSGNTSQGVIGSPSIDGMKEWLQQLGHADSDLSVIHVAGTKGKGSTCAFVDSFLREHGKRTGFPKSVGLYTSPTLLSTRERIRIDSKPISEAAFAQYFFDVWNKLGYTSQANIDAERMPRYRQFLMLLSFHVFVLEKVDVAIYETHVGGEYDATNVVVPVVTGITALGMDHVRALGPSIENIAWHKAGIMKHNVPAFSDHQEPVVAEVLQLRAAEKNAPLKFTDIDPNLPEKVSALEPNVQKKNASLARALADTFLRLKAPGSQSLVAQDILYGIEHYSWPGRFQKIVDGNYQWFLDIAHNEISLLVAAQWFAQQVSDTESNVPAPTRILIFTHTSGRSSGRDDRTLMKSIASPLQARGIRFDHVIITTLKERQFGAKRIDCIYERPETFVSQDAQRNYARIWKDMDSEANISLTSTVEGALQMAKDIGDPGSGMQTFITGDTGLVGIALYLLEEDPIKVSKV